MLFPRENTSLWMTLPPPPQVTLPSSVVPALHFPALVIFYYLFVCFPSHDDHGSPPPSFLAASHAG